MTCKFLSTSKRIMPGGTEIGGSPLPYAIDMPICKLGRKPDILFWASKCNETPQEGLCWFWIEENGNQAMDVKFNQSNENGG
jgi:hypothetical protein